MHGEPIPTQINLRELQSTPIHQKEGSFIQAGSEALLATVDSNMFLVGLIHHLLHEADIIVLRKLSVLLKVRAFVLRHRAYKMLDNFVWDERVPKVKLCDIWL